MKENINSGEFAPSDNNLSYYLGRLEAFHSVLAIAAPGQPRFQDINIPEDHPLEYCDAALDAVHRRLGSAISKLSLLQREDLRHAILELGRKAEDKARIAPHSDAIYDRALQGAYRQIIAAITMHAASNEWLV